MTDNDALGYARDLLAPFGFVPVLAPAHPRHRDAAVLRQSLTTANFFYDIRFHYTAIILAALGPGDRRGHRPAAAGGLRRFAVGLVAACALATSVAWGISPISTQYRTGYWPLAGNARQAVLDTAVAAVPDDAAVSASYYIVPHLSHRTQIYTFPNPWIPRTGASPGGAARPGPRPHSRRGRMDRRRPDGARPRVA